MAVYKLLLALSCRVIGEIRSSSTLCMCFVGAPARVLSHRWPVSRFSFPLFYSCVAGSKASIDSTYWGYPPMMLPKNIQFHHHVRRVFVHIRTKSFFSGTPNPTRLTLPRRARESATLSNKAFSARVNSASSVSRDPYALSLSSVSK